MPYSLRLGQRDFPLPPGRFVIGRSDDCQLCVEDPLASRHHAAVVVDGETLTLEDLGSRNGVFLNHARVSQPEPLKHGDVVKIGSLELTIIQRRSVRSETLAQMNTQTGMSSFGLLSGLADKAIALGRGDETERILGRQLEMLLERARSEALDAATFSSAAAYALRIAALTKKAKWIDYLFQLHAARQALMDAELVNQLYALCPKVQGASRAAFRDYIASLSEHRPNYGPSERFILSRLDSLEKQL